MCDKNTYLTRKSAKKYANRFQKEGLKKSRPYLCEECNFWHLSTRARIGAISIDRNTAGLRYREEKRQRNET